LKTLLICACTTLLAAGCTPTGASHPSAPPENMVLVPEGSFLMGSTEEEIDAIHKAYGVDRVMYEAETPQRRIGLPGFYIDKHEVTQGDYAGFLQATSRDAPFVDAEWAALYNWVDGKPPDGLENHPVVLVSFDDAAEYCRWAGKQLPTEAQWEKAARGADGRQYPWGDGWDRTRLNSAAAWAPADFPTSEDWLAWWKTTYHGELRGGVITTKPVGAYPQGASPCGALDLAGNVFEWTRDWYDAYPGSKYKNPEFGQQYRAIRGGDWYLDPIYTRTAARLRSPPDHKVPTIGFRCVAGP
jgi:formylglycine-generating enzyme required for sulfatase activity